MTAHYPPEFLVEIVYHSVPYPVPDGKLLLTCMACGVHHQFASDTTLERLNIEAEAHTNVHLREALYDRNGL